MNVLTHSDVITQLEATDVFERKVVVQDILLMRKRKIAKVKKTQFVQQFSSLKFSFRFLSPALDDDECALSRHNCFDPYECHNTKGTFGVIKRNHCLTAHL